MRANRLRGLLDAGKPTVGTRLASSWPSVVEAVGHTGAFDYVEFLGENAPFDLYALDNFCRAVELFDMTAIMKIDREPREFLAQRAIGAGFQGIVFTDARTADDVRQCVRSARPDTPTANGAYGLADRRFSYWGKAGTVDYVRALEQIVVVLMIEKGSAVENLDEILSVPGIDLVQWGGGDYSMSIGRPGGRSDSDIRAIERRVIAAALARGIRPRGEVTSLEEVRYYMDLGVRDFSFSTDLRILFDSLKESGHRLRELLEA